MVYLTILNWGVTLSCAFLIHYTDTGDLHCVDPDTYVQEYVCKVEGRPEPSCTGSTCGYTVECLPIFETSFEEE